MTRYTEFCYGSAATSPLSEEARLDARRRAVRRWVAAAITLTIASAPATAGALPGAPAAPAQEPTQPGDPDLGASTLVDDATLVDLDASVVATKLDDFAEEIETQLSDYREAQKAVEQAQSALADADSALQNTQLLIEETTVATDEVVVDAFMNPPSEQALETLAAPSLTEATVRQSLLTREADKSADKLSDLEQALADYEQLEAAQQEKLEEAQTARADADAKFADLKSALSAQAEFVALVEQAVDSRSGDAADDPDLQERAGQIDTLLADAAEKRAEAQRLREAEEERQRMIREGIMFCPVDGNVSFIDSWGFARSGGRTHKGVDMMAAHGTPTVAPVSGRVEHRGTSLGGYSWYVYGDNGNTYYGTHLQSYANVGAGHVEAGTLIGYVGSSGNASASGPHLHFEIHPGGGAPVNPYPLTAQACFG
jgi:murein DD-endopeptidase MepM/ murein hydrolase activator NlpD